MDYDGTVRQLYVDGYRFSEPKAPVGLVCGASRPLDPPGPDPFETRRQLITLAATLDATATNPISLDADGSATHGVVFDHVRLIGKAFAAAASAGVAAAGVAAATAAAAGAPAVDSTSATVKPSGL